MPHANSSCTRAFGLVWTWWLCALALFIGGAPAAAQRADSARAGLRSRPDSAQQPRAAVQRRDSLAPPISPRRAFLYSLLIPGLGQSKLQRPTAGAVYVAFEFTAITMLGKSKYDLAVAKRRARDRIVNSYAVDSDGRPVFDSLGRPVVKDTVPNRYVQTGTDQLRSRVKARRLHYEDWVAMLAFTHLFAGADAFVSAHLWDLPRQVEVRALPSGQTGVGARIPFR
ncbi:MAG: DUF5683 domain-containing protein [Gemmatimonadaceae bacterium]